MGAFVAGEIMTAPWRNLGLAFLPVLALLSASAVAPARSEEPAAPALKEAQAACQPAAFRVAIDVGHTVAVPGAMSARGATEYSFNLRLGEAIKQALVKTGFDKTELLITATAPPAGLLERAVRANKMHADLFLAVHHDSVPDNLLQTWDYDGQQYYYNDNYPGYALFVSYDNPDRASSVMFGHMLGEALQSRGLGYTPHYILPLMGHRRRQLVDDAAGIYRYDQLVVLRMTRMPALLLEAGSIVNRREELELASPERVALESAAVAAAVADFCTARAKEHVARIAKHAPARQPASHRSPVHTAKFAR
jgi:N-acetylmuramoyl-L-alanine amidase